ncbi:uncharacterized protein LOC128549762 [Mercenaria mercenaria]|uniref:uncharacterized protein LOC128549762 n=1 Tax=Mercenaria mercenaria TaxID=6596 RepID=UPI00234FAFCF|nr:uncharacterized protein LOC128549762 [Mercenaria mercenaria]
MWKVRDLKKPKVSYRVYSPTSMSTALSEVKETGEAIRKVAKKYGIPESSLRHKLSGRVNPEAVRSGPPALFTQEEEARLADHLKFTASVGYGYSRSEVLDIATEYAIALGHRDKSNPLSFRWYEGFKSRWPDLNLIKPRGLEIQRAKATTVDCVRNYYTELGRILTKYDLNDKPERIYNVDEKGLSTTHKPPQVIAGSGTKPPSITSNSRVTVTVLGCGNALGYQVPPFFVFPGTRMRQELLEGKMLVLMVTVSESGWSNSEVFQHTWKHT